MVCIVNIFWDLFNIVTHMNYYLTYSSNAVISQIEVLFFKIAAHYIILIFSYNALFKYVSVQNKMTENTV